MHPVKRLFSTGLATLVFVVPSVVLISSGPAAAVPAAYAVLSDAPLPSDSLGTQAENSTIASISCPTAGNCTAVGTYEVGVLVANVQAFMVQQVNGLWTPATTPLLPANAASSGQVTALNAVACTSPGNCVAVGSAVQFPSMNKFPIVINQIAGVWGVAQFVDAPAGASGDLNAISCYDASDCVATGTYQIAAPSNYYPPFFNVPFVLGETAGTWGLGQSVDLPADVSLGSDPVAKLTSISCVTGAICVAVGFYSVSGGNTKPIFETWNAGTLGAVVEPSLPGGISKFYQLLSGVSCVDATNCTAIGTVSVLSGNVVGLVVQEVGGVWQTGFTLGSTSMPSWLDSVQCEHSGDCTALGGVLTGGAVAVRTFEESGGTWSDPLTISSPTTSAGNAAPDPQMSCPSNGQCTLVIPVQSLTSWNYPIYSTPSVTLLSSGVFSTPAPIPLPLDVGYHALGHLDQIDCFDATHCEALGGYLTLGQNYAVYAQDIINGVALSATPIWYGGANFAPIVQSISCWSYSNCVALLQSSSGQGAVTYVETETNGVWVSSTPFANGYQAESVSCVLGSSFCAIVGLDVGTGLAFGVTLTGTTFSAVQEISPAQFPSEATDLHAVSCWAVGQCAAVGQYSATSQQMITNQLVSTLANGVWSAGQTPWAPQASYINRASLTSLSCVSATACMAGGAQSYASFTTTLSGSTWSLDNGVTFPLPQNTVVSSSTVTGVSCVDAANCVASGFYEYPSRHDVAFVAPGAISTSAAGVSLSAQPLTAPYSGLNDPAKESAQINAISCVSSSTCEFVGTYGSISATAQLPVIGGSGVPAPGAPTNLSALSGDRSVKLSWTAPLANGGTAIQHYVATVGTQHCSTTATSCTVAGLYNGQTYVATVQAVSSVGTGPAASSISVLAASVPDAPSVTGVIAGPKSVLVALAPPDNDGGSAVTSYTFFWSLNGVTHSAGNSILNTELITGLPNGADVSVFATANNSVGSSVNSAPLQVLLPALPNPPTGVVAIGAVSSIKVTWLASAVGFPITGYRAYASFTNDDETTQTYCSTTTATSCTISGLFKQAQYFVWVDSTNAVGNNSSLSVQSTTSAHPPTNPGAPTLLKAKATKNTATLTWRAPRALGGGLAGYIVKMYLKKSWVQVAQPARTSVTLRALTPKTIYHVEVISRALDGAQSVATPLSFATS